MISSLNILFLFYFSYFRKGELKYSGFYFVIFLLAICKQPSYFVDRSLCQFFEIFTELNYRSNFSSLLMLCPFSLPTFQVYKSIFISTLLNNQFDAMYNQIQCEQIFIFNKLIMKMSSIRAILLVAIVLMFCFTSIVQAKSAESSKDKKAAKPIKGIKTKSEKVIRENIEEQVSCSCSCETLPNPKKSKKADQKVQDQQKPQGKKEEPKDIKKNKLPLKEGESRFKSLKKPTSDNLQQKNQEKPAEKTQTQVPEQKNQKKIKRSKNPKEQGKSKTKSYTQSAKPQPNDKGQL